MANHVRNVRAGNANPDPLGMSFARLRLDQLNDVIGQPKAGISQPDQTIMDRLQQTTAFGEQQYATRAKQGNP